MDTGVELTATDLDFAFVDDPVHLETAADLVRHRYESGGLVDRLHEPIMDDALVAVVTWRGQIVATGQITPPRPAALPSETFFGVDRSSPGYRRALHAGGLDETARPYEIGRLCSDRDCAGSMAEISLLRLLLGMGDFCADNNLSTGIACLQPWLADRLTMVGVDLIEVDDAVPRAERVPEAYHPYFVPADATKRPSLVVLRTAASVARVRAVYGTILGA